MDCDWNATRGVWVPRSHKPVEHVDGYGTVQQAARADGRRVTFYDELPSNVSEEADPDPTTVSIAKGRLDIASGDKGRSDQQSTGKRARKARPDGAKQTTKRNRASLARPV